MNLNDCYFNEVPSVSRKEVSDWLNTHHFNLNVDFSTLNELVSFNIEKTKKDTVSNNVRLLSDGLIRYLKDHLVNPSIKFTFIESCNDFEIDINYTSLKNIY